MLRHGVVNKEGKVVNVIIWDGVTKFNPPDDHVLIRNDEVNINYMWDHEQQVLFKPEPIVQEIEIKPQVSLEDLQRQLDELKAQLVTKE